MAGEPGICQRLGHRAARMHGPANEDQHARNQKADATTPFGIWTLRVHVRHYAPCSRLCLQALSTWAVIPSLGTGGLGPSAPSMKRALSSPDSPRLAMRQAISSQCAGSRSQRSSTPRSVTAVTAIPLDA